MGRADETRPIVEEFEPRALAGEPLAVAMAAIFLELGEDNRALEWLEWAVENREPRVIEFSVSAVLATCVVIPGSMVSFGGSGLRRVSSPGLRRH